MRTAALKAVPNVAFTGPDRIDWWLGLPALFSRLAAYSQGLEWSVRQPRFEPE